MKQNATYYSRLPHLTSHAAKTSFGQGLIQITQPSSSFKPNSTASKTELCPMTSFILGLNPPHSVVHVGQDKQDWLRQLHLIASYRPAHLQHDYTTILIQVGDVMPVHSFPTMWEAATMIMIGKFKQGGVWIERQGDVPCPDLCRSDKYTVSDGYLTPAHNQFIALNKTSQKVLAHQEFVSGPRICIPCAQATH